jgi:4-aminobutyrate aminotransferase-like enzyme
LNRTAKILAQLRAYESRNVTFVEPDGSWPIVWERAQGVHVWDAEGRKYLDLTAAFGVAAAGHGNPRVVRAGQQQMAKLLHAMGDVHPHALKAELAEELSRITFGRWGSGGQRPDAGGRMPDAGCRTPDANGRYEASGIRHPASGIQHPTSAKTIFCNSGFEAVEAALKTALLATGRIGVIAFEGAYHGLGYGALNATHREHFRSPFRRQLREFAHFAPFPLVARTADQCASTRHHRSAHRQDASAIWDKTESGLRGLLAKHRIGAILVEPMQARGGVRIPPPKFLPLLRRLCDEHGTLLILDEIYTGFGRTGAWFACEHSGVVPDLICLGKALTGGFPLSACVGRAGVMDAAWPLSNGEAIHTSTFLGHPVGCAMALAQIAEIRRRKLVERSARLGESLLRQLASLRTANSGLQTSARGLGLMAGLELQHADGSPATVEALTAIKAMLHAGFILLPEGAHANVISFTPPLSINERQLRQAAAKLAEVLSPKHTS